MERTYDTERAPSSTLDPLASRAAAPLRWDASARAPAPALRAAGSGEFLVQAGSFRSQDNAERARERLGAIAPVEVAQAQFGDETLYRVRVGPFASREAAAAALSRVTDAGYTGAKIVTN
jgi:cell division protein FtsN